MVGPGRGIAPAHGRQRSPCCRPGGPGAASGSVLDVPMELRSWSGRAEATMAAAAAQGPCDDSAHKAQAETLGKRGVARGGCRDLTRVPEAVGPSWAARMAGRRRRRPSAAAREADDTRAELTAEAAVNKAAAARAKEERAALLARQAERKAEKARVRRHAGRDIALVGPDEARAG